MIKIYITEDHETYLEGLALLLKKQADITIVGTSLSGADLLQQLPAAEIDILLLDVHLPDLSEEVIIKEVRKLKPRMKVIYLTMMRGTRNVHRLMNCNIQGYLLKNASLEELLTAVRLVHDGGTYFSKDIDVNAGPLSYNNISLEDTKVSQILSKREIEILKLVCKEYSNAKIARELFLSISTVETHRKNLISKLGVTNTVGLVKFAIRNKLVD